MNSIMIATLKDTTQLKTLLDELKSKAIMDYEIIISSSPNSVAYNSNRGLERCKGTYILKVDDDVFDFPQGWDKTLIDTFENDPSVIMASARILNRDGSIQNTCSQNFDLTPDIVEPQTRLVPFCLVAFRNDGLRFDERYVGSSFDDTDFNYQLRMKYPNGKIVINNKIKIKHMLESKICRFGENEKKFYDKWRGIKFPNGEILVP